MSTCDEISVTNIVDHEKTKRRRKKPTRFEDSSSSARDSDDDETTYKKDKGAQSDDLEMAKLQIFNYIGGKDIETTEPVGDGDFLKSQEPDYGDYFDDPPQPNYKQSEVKNKPVISKIEAIVIPGIGGKGTTSADKDCQKLKSLSQQLLDDSKHLNNPESKPTTTHGVGSKDIVANRNINDDGKNGAGFSTTKESFITPGAPSLPPAIDSVDHINDSTVQSLEPHNCCPACRSVLISISRKLDTLLNIHADNPRPTMTQQANILPKFAMSSYADLVKFNQLLIDNELARTQYEDLIKQRRNTSDGKKCIRSVLGFILTDELCCKLSWSGQKKTIKVENMPFVEHLRDTVVSNSRSSLDDCKQAIMSWLQHANDRVKIAAGKHNSQ